MLVKKNTSHSILFIALAIFFVTSCNDKNNNQGSEIPNVYVNFYLQPDGIDFIPTQSWRYYDEGYRGIIVYRLDQFVFYAYERTCSYDPQNECARVEVDNSGVLMVDSCCMSYFNILDGMPAGGLAIYPLKQYFTEFDGTTLHIYNTP